MIIGAVMILMTGKVNRFLFAGGAFLKLFKCSAGYYYGRL